MEAVRPLWWKFMSHSLRAVSRLTRLQYCITGLVLFLTELCIALYLHDKIIRPYIGDILVVILIYAAAQAVLRAPVLPVATGVLVFAVAIEVSQYFKIIRKLNLQHNRMASIVLGSSFSWLDIVCYVVGILVVLASEAAVNRYRD